MRWTGAKRDHVGVAALVMRASVRMSLRPLTAAQVHYPQE